jgi:hypothetical protein
MNERIEKFSEQARQYADTYGDRYDPIWFHMYNEKFAELIVRECILTIQMGITRDGTKTEKFKRSMTHIKDIKEHFGVEE